MKPGQKLFSLLPLFLISASACRLADAGQEQNHLAIVKNGKSNYQIILPDQKPRPSDYTGRNLMECAELLRNCILEGTGAELAIVPEGKADPRKPGIYLGNTVFARNSGVRLSSMKQWQYLRRTAGNNLILAGLDERGPIGKERTYYSIGTMKAVTAFLQEQAGVKFLLPGENGIHVPKRKNIVVPCGELLRKPNLEFNIGVHPTNPYSIANNFYHAPYFNSHGGHSYYDAVPRSKYAEAHPEYFAMSGGRRNTNAGHLCISNSEVQELIYRELVTELDRGFEMTELGQTDGYMPCECEACRTLYGVDSPGEKLWIFHRSLAERLKKERPGKKVVILSYGPTAAPPKTFRSFPENVMIELCSYSPENIAAWKQLDVPGGFMAYIYNWGNYQIQGFTAKFGPRSCEDQIRLFHENRVRGLYRCGFGELFGMEGPLYYAWGRGFDTPGPNTIRPLLDEFYTAAYGKARAPMRKFFTVLYERLDYFENAQKFSGAITNPLTALSMIYTPDILSVMEKNLTRAEAVPGLTEKERARIFLVRSNFEYTRNLARIVIFYNAFRMDPSGDTYAKLAEELVKRNRMIDPIRKNAPGARAIAGWPDCPFRAESAYIQGNGRLRDTINAPLNWDLEKIRKQNLIPGLAAPKILEIPSAEKISMDGDFNSGAWRKAPWNVMESASPGNNLATRFKILCDRNAFYIAFTCTMPKGGMQNFVPLGRDGPAWEQECLEILLDIEGNRERYYHFIFNPVADSWYDAARGYIADPLHPLYNKPDLSWNGKWEYRNFLDREKNVWQAVARIPFASLGLDSAPESGTRWTANFGREHIPAPHAVPQLLLWSPSRETSSFHDPDSYGEIYFK